MHRTTSATSEDVEVRGSSPVLQVKIPYAQLFLVGNLELGQAFRSEIVT